MNENILVPNQPYYFPQLHWWNRSLRGKFIMLDDVPHNIVHPSNRAFCNNGERDTSFSVPIKDHHKYCQIKDVLINNNYDWRVDHLNKFKSFYSEQPFFEEGYEILNETLSFPFKYLLDVLIEAIDMTTRALKIDFDFLISSELSEQIKCNSKDKNEKFIKYAQILNCDTVLFGSKSLEINKELYDKANIKLEYQSWRPKIDNRSVLDAVVRYGLDETKQFMS